MFRILVQGRRARTRRPDASPGPDVDTTVVAGIRRQLLQRAVSDEAISNSDRELVERCVDRIVVKADRIEVWWAHALSPGRTFCRERLLGIGKQTTRHLSALDYVQPESDERDCAHARRTKYDAPGNTRRFACSDCKGAGVD